MSKRITILPKWLLKLKGKYDAKYWGLRACERYLQVLEMKLLKIYESELSDLEQRNFNIRKDIPEQLIEYHRIHGDGAATKPENEARRKARNSANLSALEKAMGNEYVALYHNRRMKRKLLDEVYVKACAKTEMYLAGVTKIFKDFTYELPACEGLKDDVHAWSYLDSQIRAFGLKQMAENREEGDENHVETYEE